MNSKRKTLPVNLDHGGPIAFLGGRDSDFPNGDLGKVEDELMTIGRVVCNVFGVHCPFETGCPRQITVDTPPGNGSQ